MRSKVILYFSDEGSFLCDNDRISTLRILSRSKYSPEHKLRAAWYALGRGLKEAMDDGVEFLTIASPTKVIDQLNGSIIEDYVIDKMFKEIVEKAFPNFLSIEKKKMSYDEYKKRWEQAVRELGDGTFESRTPQ